MIRLIVGLGNPDIKYQNTRHNIGNNFVKLLAKKNKKIFKLKKKFFGFISEFQIFNKKIFLLLPQTYVNNSGQSVLAFVDYYQIKIEEILIVHDELNLPPGVAKIKFGGSNNGHNGLKDIQKKIKTPNFYRLRIGIGHPGKKNEVNNFVLSTPTIYDKNLIKNAMNESINCLYFFDDINKLQNKLHSFKAF